VYESYAEREKESDEDRFHPSVIAVEEKKNDAVLVLVLNERRGFFFFFSILCQMEERREKEMMGTTKKTSELMSSKTVSHLTIDNVFLPDIQFLSLILP
jgi:hypothetical protein